MACGVVVPVTRDLIEEVTLDTLAWRRSDPGQVAQDPRFATAIYRAAFNSGIMCCRETIRTILLRLDLSRQQARKLLGLANSAWRLARAGLPG